MNKLHFTFRLWRCNHFHIKNWKIILCGGNLSHPFAIGICSKCGIEHCISFDNVDKNTVMCLIKAQHLPLPH